MVFWEASNHEHKLDSMNGLQRKFNHGCSRLGFHISGITQYIDNNQVNILECFATMHNCSKSVADVQ